MATDQNDPWTSSSKAGKGLAGGITGKRGGGEAAGAGEPDSGKPVPVKRATRQGKTITFGGQRTVKYYRFNDHELDLITAPEREAARATAIASFLSGLVVTTITSFSFDTPSSEIVKGAWIALGCLSAVGAAYFFLHAKALKSKAQSKLEKIKDEHDFT